MQLRSFIFMGLCAVLGMSSQAFAGMPANMGSPQSAEQTDVIKVAAKSDTAQLKILKRKKNPTPADLAEIKQLEAKIAADKEAAQAKALEARKLAMRDFFATSLVLSIVARYGEKPIDILDRAPATTAPAGGNNAGKGVLDQLPGSTTPAAPAGNTTAPTPPSGNGATATPPATAPAPASGTTTPAPASGTTTTAPATNTAPAAPQVPKQ